MTEANHQAPGAPDAFQDERAELRAVLESASFTRAPTLSRLLAFLCEQYFAGQADFLKEYTIGTQALGRGSDFDPDRDSVVRVMATRLRKRLAAYYAAEGVGHRYRIQLPETGYIPRFLSQATETHDRPESSAEPVLPPRRRRWDWWLLIKAAVALGVAALVFTALRGSRATPSAPTAPMAVAAAANPQPASEILIDVGNDSDYRDGEGRLWSADRYCAGGTVVRSPDRRIYRTADPVPYRTAREGSFSCDIPVPAGIHEVRLHFAELVMGDKSPDISGEGWRRFNIALNGKIVIEDFDIIRDAAGSNIADQKVLLNVEPAADGFLHFRFDAAPNAALINAIEVLPGARNRMHPARILCGGGPYYTKAGVFWQADQFYVGGNALKHTLEVLQSDDPGLCKSERWGNFNYSIPVADGSYKVTLRFAERHFGTVDFTGDRNRGGEGSRVFNVFCNEEVLLRNFDVFRQAGGGRRETIQTFRRLKPNAQGKLVLSFVPVKDYAMVNAIEVEPEDEKGGADLSLPLKTR